MGRTKKVLEVLPLHQFRGTKAEQLRSLYDQWYGCQKCDLHQHRSGPDIVFADGNPDSGILIIGEAPGEQEDKTGIPFFGPAGGLLNQLLAQTSADPQIREKHKALGRARSNKASDEFQEEMLTWRQQEFFMTNVVGCRPPENATPNDIQVKGCWERLYNLIYIVDPVLIITAGKTALEALAKKKMEITKLRGQLLEAKIPGRLGEVSYPVMPVFHPSYLLRKADWNTKGGDYDKTLADLRKGFQIVDNIRNASYGMPIPDRGGHE